MIAALRWNFVVLVIGLALLAGVGWLYFHYPAGYAAAMGLWKVDIGSRPYMPFCDISEALSAAQCTRNGIPIYPFDFCDIWQRPHSYPILMGWWDWLFPDPRHLMLVGVGLAVAAIFAISFSSRPRSLGEAGLLALLMASPTVAFALERANMDVAVFLLCATAAMAGARRWIVASDLAILFAGLLKFYPIVAVVAVLTQPPRKAFLLVSATLLVFAGYLYLGLHDVVAALSGLENGKWDSADFGGRETYAVVALISGFFSGPHIAPVIAACVCAAIFGAIAVSAIRIGATQRQPPNLATYSELSFFIGGITIWAVFLVSDNIAYRGVLLLLLVPLLLERRRSEAASDRLTANALLASLGLILWLPALYSPALTVNQRLLLFWLVKDPLWLVSLGLIGALVLSQAMRCPSGERLVRLYRRNRQTVPPQGDR